jgi:hypothetical protein
MCTCICVYKRESLVLSQGFHLAKFVCLIARLVILTCKVDHVDGLIHACNIPGPKPTRRQRSTIHTYICMHTYIHIYRSKSHSKIDIKHTYTNTYMYTYVYTYIHTGTSPFQKSFEDRDRIQHAPSQTSSITSNAHASHSKQPGIYIYTYIHTYLYDRAQHAQAKLVP